MNIIVHGFRGKLGAAITRLAVAGNDTVAAGIDAREGGANPFPAYKSIADCEMPADCLIDASHATAVGAAVEYCAERRLPAVICTTGLSDGTLALINDASRVIPIFRSANMSIGVNLIGRLCEYAAKALSDYDIEIIERHHNQKADAPSGTALLLAERMNNAKDNEYNYKFGRNRQDGARHVKEIGIHAIRGGTITGDHTVLFAGQDEVIEITHKAASKDVFAAGALRAARFILGKTPGLYDMESMLGAFGYGS